MCEKTTTPTTRAYTRNSPGAEMVQVGRSTAVAHKPVAAAATRCRAERLRRQQGRCIKGGKVACLLFWFLCPEIPSALKLFKLSSARAACFRASVPPCCRPTLHRSATSDVGSGSSFIHPLQQPLRNISQLAKGHFTDTTRFLGATHQPKPDFPASKYHVFTIFSRKKSCWRNSFCTKYQYFLSIRNFCTRMTLCSFSPLSVLAYSGVLKNIIS